MATGIMPIVGEITAGESTDIGDIGYAKLERHQHLRLLSMRHKARRLSRDLAFIVDSMTQRRFERSLLAAGVTGPHPVSPRR